MARRVRQGPEGKWIYDGDHRRKSHPFTSKSFKELQHEWYEKLAESGFVDIENDEEEVKQYAANSYRGASQEERIAKLDFFMKLSQHVMSTHFKNKTERFVMECYANGIKQVNIRKRLASIGIQRHRITIYRTIQKWLRIWNLK